MKLKKEKNNVYLDKTSWMGMVYPPLRNPSPSHPILRSSLFLEYGKPAVEGEYRIVFSVAIPAELQNDNLFHEFIEVGEFPLSGDLTAS